MNKTFVKRSSWFFFVIFCAGSLFLLGFFVNEKRTFPFSMIRYSYYKSINALNYYNFVQSSSTTKKRINNKTDDGLKGLGYLGAVEEASGAVGLNIHNEQRAGSGYTLFSPSIEGPGGNAVLVDMGGDVVHEWHVDIVDAFGEIPDGPGTTDHFRNAYLFPDGRLLAIFSHHGMVMLDGNSNVLWSTEGMFHHDFWISDDNEIYVALWDPNVVEEFNGASATYEELITKYTLDGEKISESSLTKAIAKSEYAGLPEFFPRKSDALHNNTVNYIRNVQTSSPPSFQEGRFLVSPNNGHTIGVFDYETGTLNWALSGLTHSQHDPRYLDNGNILVYDNRYRTDQSRVIEINPSTHEIEWQYTKPDFYSDCCGRAERLSNGNTLITETDSGRIIEVTPKKEVVWEYINPKTEDGMMGRVFQARRYSPEYPGNWVN